MEKVDYLHFEAWLLIGKPHILESEKESILEQFKIREKEIANLKDKLHRRNTLVTDLRGQIFPKHDCIINTIFKDSNSAIQERIKYCVKNCNLKCLNNQEYKKQS